MDRFSRKKGFTNIVPERNSFLNAFLDGLNVSKKVVRDSNGNEIITKRHGMYEKAIYNPQQEIITGNRVCVYVGNPSIPFSEYSKALLTEKCSHYWNTIPETDLSRIHEKKLLILPCPVRILTTQELSTIRGFLKGSRRLVLFSGSDTTVANSILRQLESKLEIIPFSFAEAVYNMSGKITQNQLVWWPGYPVGWIGVYRDYWSTAKVIDWKGYGLLYDNITDMSPANYSTVWQLPENESIISFYGNYFHSSDQISKVNDYDPEEDLTWTMSWINMSIPLYPVGYIPYDYSTPFSLYEWRDWMNANIDNLPIYRIFRNGYALSKTSFAGGQYIDFLNSEYRGLSGSFLSYVTGERIVVASFKPLWLTVNYDASDIDDWYKTKELSNWLYASSLSYMNLFDQGGYSPFAPSTFHCQRGSDGSGSFYQF